MNEVEKMFQDKVIIRSGIAVYTKQDASDFIRQCSIANVIILGIDGFFLYEQGTQPSMEDSVDFSNKDGMINVYEEAINFIEKRSENLFFEITCK